VVLYFYNDDVHINGYAMRIVDIIVSHPRRDQINITNIERTIEERNKKLKEKRKQDEKHYQKMARNH